MVTKVNSGVYSDQVLAGSLRAFIIGHGSQAADLTALTATADGEVWTLRDGAEVAYDLGDAVPDTLGELVYRVLSTRATIVSLEVNESENALHVLMENASGWGYNSVDGSNAADPSATPADAMTGLVAELDKLAGIPFSKVGGAGTAAAGYSVIETRVVFDATEGALGQLLDGATDKTIGGLGGNEHDQDTDSNDISAP